MNPNDPRSDNFEPFQTERFGHESAPPAGVPKASTSGACGGKCLVWGCLGSMAFAVLLLVGGGFGLYFLLTQQVQKYTDVEPGDIPIVEATPEDVEAIQARIDQFSQTARGDAKSGKDDVVGQTKNDVADKEDLVEKPVDVPDSTTPEPAPTELVLTADELNALIASNPELRGRLFVEIKEGRVSGQVSAPTDFLPGGKGRFFNADAEFDVSMQDGVLVVRVVNASVKGQPIPQEIMEPIASENLAKDAYKDADNAKTLRRFKSIEVVEDKIVLKLKVESVDAPESPENLPPTSEAGPIETE